MKTPLSHIPKQGYLRSMTQAQFDKMCVALDKANPVLAGKAFAKEVGRCYKVHGSEAPLWFLGHLRHEVPDLRLYFRRKVEEMLASEESI